MTTTSIWPVRVRLATSSDEMRSMWTSIGLMPNAASTFRKPGKSSGERATRPMRRRFTSLRSSRLSLPGATATRRLVRSRATTPAWSAACRRAGRPPCRPRLSRARREGSGGRHVETHAGVRLLQHVVERGQHLRVRAARRSGRDPQMERLQPQTIAGGAGRHERNQRGDDQQETGDGQLHSARRREGSFSAMI